MLTDENDNYTTETKILYSEPVKMMANISPATGNSSAEQFGGLDNYDKVIVTDDMDCPIDEQSVLFVDCEPGALILEKSLSSDETHDAVLFGNVFAVLHTQREESEPLYDYIVKRVAKSLNSISIAISKVKVS